MHSNDFSLFALFTAGLATLVKAEDLPNANAIYLPGTGSIVPVGKPFDITWNPTTPYSGGTVSLYLCKGPSSNCVTVGPIATGTENDGLYSWTPETSLEDSNGDTGYGMKIVFDSNGAYQWSTQFGISNKKSASSSSSSSAAASTTASVKVDSVTSSASSERVVTETLTAFTTYCPEATTLTHNSKTYTVTGASSVSLDCSNGGCVVTRPVYTSTVTSCKDCATATPVVSTPAVSFATSTKSVATTAVTTVPAVVSSVAGNTKPAASAPPAGNTQPAASTPPAGARTPVAGTPVTTPGAQYTGAASSVKVGGVVGMVAGMAGAFFAL
ncbi:Ser-Thr-rich glycosyl-phosphatidyl-inositol-anchored membrane family-domain-containing protein [Phyllosticta citrichinensis]|uniref:Ser-Thr-rich glycosyl-phosphatidyl-inositol-anchored membrane family-domain-containing protein n=1 Tax=Phyllosticta citrichinensis TaxID=1130410 RepID=A0ABR1XSR2_9PEZI